MKKLLVLLLAGTMLANCSATTGFHKPIVDRKGVDNAVYEKDLAECQEYAKDGINPVTGAVVGAVTGAVIGTVVDKILSPGNKENIGGRIGTIYGAGGGAKAGMDDQKNIVKKCMSGRGYKVLS